MTKTDRQHCRSTYRLLAAASTSAAAIAAAAATAAADGAAIAYELLLLWMTIASVDADHPVMIFLGGEEFPAKHRVEDCFLMWWRRRRRSRRRLRRTQKLD